MREAPYAYCIGRRNCYLVHNSGKSNFIGAIQFALTGEQPPFDKKDLLSWGADSGYVKLRFEHNGKDCLVQRRIESAGCTLKVGEEEFRGARNVADAMANVVGIDKEILRQSVFVRQTEVESCLFTDPRERELNFQRLLGLGDAAKVNKQLGDIISGLGTPESMDEAISQAQAVIDAKKPEIAEIESVVSEITGRMSSFPKLEDIDEEISSKTAEIARERDRIKYARLVKECEDAFAKALAEHGETAGRQIPDTATMMLDLKAWEDRLRLARDLEAASKALDEAERRHREAEDAKDLSEEIGRVRDDEAKCSEELNQTRGEMKSLEKLLEACSEGDGRVCPLCGSTADHDIGKELRDRASALSERESSLGARVRELSDMRRKLEADQGARSVRIASAKLGLQKAQSTMEACFRRVDGDLDELEESRIVPVIEDLRKRLSTANDEASSIQIAMDAVKGASDRLDTAKDVAEKAGVENAGQVVEEVSLHVISNLESEIAKAKEKRVALLQMREDLVGARAAKEQAEKAVRETEEAIVRLRGKQRENDELRRRIGVLTDVRDWFSYKNGPRVLTQRVMSALTDSVNHYLDRFGAAFTVEPSDEGMGFLVRFCDGRPLPDPLPDASRLSGGQKIALAVAFRFAVYTLFSNKLGLLSLDEPTAYLDTETIGRFGDLLQRIAQIARNSSLQVIMATHEESLKPAFDQTITIGG